MSCLFLSELFFNSLYKHDACCISCIPNIVIWFHHVTLLSMYKVLTLFYSLFKWTSNVEHEEWPKSQKTGVKDVKTFFKKKIERRKKQIETKWWKIEERVSRINLGLWIIIIVSEMIHSNSKTLFAFCIFFHLTLTLLASSCINRNV